MGPVKDAIVQEGGILQDDELAHAAQVPEAGLRHRPPQVLRQMHRGGHRVQHPPHEPEDLPGADELVQRPAEEHEHLLRLRLPDRGPAEDLRAPHGLLQGQLERVRLRLVCAGVISLAVRIFSDVDLIAVSGVVRIFRIARLFRIIRSFKEINKIFMALILSLPKLGNVMAILLLVLTLYGILGVSLFSTAKKPDDGVLNVHGNFDDFWKAFITLFRATTGEAWNELMHDLSKDEKAYYRSGNWCSPSDLFDPQNKFEVLRDKCLVETPNACVTTIFNQNILPIIYWVSYIVVCLHLMMNLVIAVILDGYEEGRHTPPEQRDIELCMERWKRYDPDITEKLPLPKAMCFVNEVVYEILKIQAIEEKEERDRKAMMYAKRSRTGDVDIALMPMQFAKCFDLNVLPDGQVSFASATRQVLRIAVTQGSGAEIGGLDEGDRHLDRRTFNRLRDLEQKRVEKVGQDIKLIIAATKLQRRWRAHRNLQQTESRVQSAEAFYQGGSISRGSSEFLPCGPEVDADGDTSPVDSKQGRETPERSSSPPKAGAPDQATTPPRAG
mmetsp:Transcript_95996/g.298925  ORF Transcript_95996/g.298925 Transcript_95996/m.298925 type:complete len:555 (-) Transcript_95996:141-1805(-)